MKGNPGLADKINLFFVSLFIIAYFVFVIAWLWLELPTEFRPARPVCKSLINTLSPIASLFGWEQNWTLFSPPVKTFNSYNLVVVTFQNGLLKLIELPRMEKLNIMEKWQNEKFRKLFNDNFPYNKYAFVRPAVSRFLSRANYQPDNVPTRLAYFMICNPIPPPTLKVQGKAGSRSDTGTSIENYYVYGINPEDF